MDILSIFALGSVSSGKHLFFDTLNINFREQDGVTKFYTNNYSYKGKDYKYIIYFISGTFSDPALLASERTYCDAVLFLINPLITGVFFQIKEAIKKISERHPQALIVFIMQNIFNNLEDLPMMQQEVAISNGEIFFEIENKYNLKICSLNYNLKEIEQLESGNPMVNFKFFKIFNDTFYEIIHECIERHNNPEKKKLVKKEVNI